MNSAQAVEAARLALGSIDGRRAYRPAVVAHDIWLASGLETVLPETVLMCVQRSSAIDVLRERGIEVFCLSEHVSKEEVAGRSSADLFEHQAAIEFCHRHGPLAVMTFKPSERFEAAVRSTSSRLVAGRGSRHMAVARSFENKLNFVEIATRAGLRTPRWEVVAANDLEYARLSATYGPRMVVQGPRGNAGQRTWLIADEAELETLRRHESGRSVRVAELVEGMPFTVNAVAHSDGLLSWTQPSRQVTGDAWLTPMALGSCGNAWGEPALEPHLAEAGQATAAIGDALGRAGFGGVFGVDFVLGPDGPVVIETNPRMVASLPLATQVELAGGRVPQLLQTLLLGLGVPDDRLVGPSQVGLPALPGCRRHPRSSSTSWKVSRRRGQGAIRRLPTRLRRARVPPPRSLATRPGRGRRGAGPGAGSRRTGDAGQGIRAGVPAGQRRRAHPGSARGGQRAARLARWLASRRRGA